MCVTESWLGDGYCDDGSWGADFDCAEYDYDYGDCDSDAGSVGSPDDAGCTDAGDVEDCNGDCHPYAWVGDGYCEDGSTSWGGDFDCAEFAYDGGDCSDSSDDWGGDAGCGVGEIEDCTGTCAWESWLGDGYCDDGGSLGVDFDCAAFAYDEGDCESYDSGSGWSGSDSWGCADTGDIEDCNGDCYPSSWVGDGYCEDGTTSWGGDFDCASFSYDGGDCSSSGGGWTEVSTCATGEVEDCLGGCAPESWLGDGFCDDGTYGAYFDCSDFAYDYGDCY